MLKTRITCDVRAHLDKREAFDFKALVGKKSIVSSCDSHPIHTCNKLPVKFHANCKMWF